MFIKCTLQASGLIEQPAAVNPERVVRLSQEVKETDRSKGGFNGAGLYQRVVLVV